MHNDENHWTNSEIAGLFLETLAHFGVFKLPIETGVKAKKKWENLVNVNKEELKARFTAKETEIKVKFMLDFRIKSISLKRRPKKSIILMVKETTTSSDRRAMTMSSSMIKEI